MENPAEIRSADLSDSFSTPDPVHDFWFKFIEEAQIAAGQVINPTTAHRCAAVYACNQAICESFAMLPVQVYSQETPQRTEALPDHWLSPLLKNGPNNWQDSFQYFETSQGWVLDYGNSVNFIEKGLSGKVLAFIPLDPTEVVIDMRDNRLVYIHSPKGGGTKEYDQEQIFHIRHKSRDGYTGRSPITVAADSVGFALGSLQHGNALFEKGNLMRGVIEAPHSFESDDARDRFVRSFTKYLGAGNSGGVGLLEQGVKYNPFQALNRDMQFIEAREFSVLDICRLYRIPPVFAQVMDKGMAYSSVEQLAIMFVQYTIQPWAIRWERAIKKQLLNRPGDEKTFVKFNLSALIRGDLKTRTEAVVSQLQNGLRTLNEARNLLDENPYTDPIGDEILLEHNLRPASQVLAAPAPEPEPAPQPAEPAPEEKSAREEVSAFRPLFENTIGRLLQQEIRSIRRASKKPDFLKWAEGFYTNHLDYSRESLRPLCTTFADLGFSTDPQPDPAIEEFLDEFYTLRTEEILEPALEGEPAADFIERITQGWGEDRGFWTQILIEKLTGKRDATGKKGKTAA